MYRNIAKHVLTLLLALWLGGLVMLLNGVVSVFGAYPKSESDVAIQAAPVLFAAFERVAPWIAIGAVLCGVIWRLRACSRAKRWLLMMLVPATIACVVSVAFITPEIDRLREAGQSGTAEFGKWHGISNIVYLAQLLFVFASTLILPSAIKSDANPSCAI